MTINKPEKGAPTELTEEPGDDMADAPPARPYAEAVTDEHKQALVNAGLWKE